MSFVELCTNAGSLIAAGADTTAITMRAVLYYALTIPRVYDRIMAELQEAYDSGLLRFPVRYEDAKKLEYLEATIKEALRYFPAGSLLLPRLSPENGAHLGGFYLPPGTQLGMTAYTYHRRAYGPDGAEFRPERWLRDPKDGDATADSKRKRREANFMSFGSGPHMCIGRNISMMEMTKVLPHLFWHFKMKITPRGPGSPHQYPYGRGMDGVINGEVWFVQGGWFTMQRDLFLDITVRKVEE
jgi:cytochrome P450